MKDEHFHPNPQIRRVRESMREAPAADAGQEQESAAPAHKIEVHHPESPENPTPGEFHTVTHHADGKTSHASHADEAAVEEHMRKHFGEELGEAKEEQCPECGGEMKDGACENCGYQERSEESEQ